MFYRVGFPFWKLVAKTGAPMMVRVNTFHDKDAGVFVATSPDLKGLIAEAETLDELEKEVISSASGLLSFYLKNKYRRNISTEMRVRESLGAALA